MADKDDGVDEGVEPCTTIEGAGVVSGRFCDRVELRLELTAEGGGDLMRGETGQCGVVGVLSPDACPEERAVRPTCSLDTASVTGPGCNWGMLVADSARWIEAAEGVELGGATTGNLLGLASWLFCLDLKDPPDLVAVRGASCRTVGRMGEELRELCGLLPAEVGAGTEPGASRVLDGCLRSVGIELEMAEGLRFAFGLSSREGLAVRAVLSGSAV